MDLSAVIYVMEQLKNKLEAYLRAREAGDKFPIDLKEVYECAYKYYCDVQKIIKEKYVNGTDFVLTQVKSVVGRPSIRYSMSVACFEYLIARWNDKVFKVYREVFEGKYVSDEERKRMSQIQRKNRYPIAEGDRFGRLVVAGKLDSGENTMPRKYRCVCDCGAERVVEAHYLTNGSISACVRCTNTKDITGQRFGRLEVIRIDGYNQDGTANWLCKCDCGNYKTIRSHGLVSGGTKSCGCLRKISPSISNRKHGQTNTRLYRIWNNMKYRCQNANSEAFRWYGGKGVQVCEEWLGSFEAFHDWSILSGYREDLTIDRINPDVNYCPENCRWVTQTENSRHSREDSRIEIDGESLSPTGWAKRFGVNKNTALSMYRRTGEEYFREAIKKAIRDNDTSMFYMRKK